MRTVKFEYNGKQAVYVPLGLARDMQDRGENTDVLKLDPNHVWWTVHHTDNSWVKPSWIAKGTGLVNRMGFIAGPADMFVTDGDPAVAVYRNSKVKNKFLYALRDIAREADDSDPEDNPVDLVFCTVDVSEKGAVIVKFTGDSDA